MGETEFKTLLRKNDILKKALIHSIALTIGFEESKVYNYLLHKEEKRIFENFSYSKSYRIMKNLFEKGVLGKIRTADKEFFSYFLLPPSDYFLKIEKEMIDFLTKIYLKNHLRIFNKDFFHVIVKDERPLIEFLNKFFSPKKISFEFFSLKNKEGYERIGYISLL